MVSSRRSYFFVGAMTPSVGEEAAGIREGYILMLLNAEAYVS